jgi:hypothetical protein
MGNFGKFSEAGTDATAMEQPDTGSLKNLFEGHVSFGCDCDNPGFRRTQYPALLHIQTKQGSAQCAAQMPAPLG